jgi:hypothetical protein
VRFMRAKFVPAAATLLLLGAGSGSAQGAPSINYAAPALVATELEG